MRCRCRAFYFISCSVHNKLAIGEYCGILIGLAAVVHFYYEQCDTAPYIDRYSQLEYAGILL